MRRTIEDLETSRTPWVVDTAPSGLHGWNQAPLAVVPALQQYVLEHYRLVAAPAGALVYRRR